MSRILAVLVATLCVVPRARGADIVAYRATGTYGAVGYEATVIWGQGEYLLDMWSRLGADSQSFAKNRQAAEAALEQRLEAVFLQSVVLLPLSSRETVGSRVKSAPATLSQLKGLVGSAVKRRSNLTPEMEDLRLRFAFPLYGAGGLLSIFAPAGEPSPLERYLGFAPAAAYTGLVVYAQGSYPAWGREGARASLKPCLFPRIFDDDMNLVVDATQADRARLSSWGVAAYSNDLDETPYLDRIGANPLRIVARAVFGTGDGDIVISRDAARLLLSREENIRMLAEGRILVILDAATAPPPPGDGQDGADGPLQELTPENPAAVKRPGILAPATGR
jgi:hypothetical protein